MINSSIIYFFQCLTFFHVVHFGTACRVTTVTLCEKKSNCYTATDTCLNAVFVALNKQGPVQDKTHGPCDLFFCYFKVFTSTPCRKSAADTCFLNIFLYTI